MKHGVDQVMTQPRPPCKNSDWYNGAPNQQYYVFEWRKRTRDCSDDESVDYEEIANDMNLNEYDLHQENGILEPLN